MKKAKYKVGDRVRVKMDLVEDRMYGTDLFIDSMKEFLGKTVTIESKREDGGEEYLIKEDSHKKDYERCFWTPEMFEGDVQQTIE